MAAPLRTAKSTVNLAATGVRGSRIRRDPPVKERVKEVSAQELRDIEQRRVLIGILAVALAVVVIITGIATQSGGSLSGFVIRM